MIDLDLVTEFMMQNFEQVKITKGGTHFLARCIICGDSKKTKFKKRFNLDWNNGVPGWNCFNCGNSGNFFDIYSFVKGLGYDDAVKELCELKWDKSKIENEKFLEVKKVKKSNKKVEKTEYDFILEDCYSLEDEENRYVKALKKFYEDRQINKEYKIYIAYKGEYKNRIIIPIFDEDRRIVYFQARRIPKTGILPKYNNPPTPKELLILNENRFDKDKSIIITEGLIDAFSVGKQGTSCLGKYISEEFIKKLRKLTNKDLIVALDNDTDAYKALGKFMNNNKYASEVKYFIYPSEFQDQNDINNIACKSNKDVFEIITLNSVDYYTCKYKLSMLKLLGGKNENHKVRNGLYNTRRKNLPVRKTSIYSKSTFNKARIQ